MQTYHSRKFLENVACCKYIFYLALITFKVTSASKLEGQYTRILPGNTSFNSMLPTSIKSLQVL